MHVCRKECEALVAHYRERSRNAHESVRLLARETNALFSINAPWQILAALSRHRDAQIELAETFAHLAETYERLKPAE